MASKFTSKLLGARVLVLGGSSGIGFGVAEGALEFGAAVHVASSKEERVSAAVAKLKQQYPDAADRVTGSVCDLSDREAQETRLTTLLDEATKHGKLDHIVFTAGDAVPFPTIDKVQSNQFDTIGCVRFYGAIILAKLAPKFLNPGPKSSLTLTGGVLASKPVPYLGSLLSAYSAAIEGLIRGLAHEIKPVRVNAVAPGAVATDHLDNNDSPATNAKYEAYRKATVLDTVGTPQEVAEAYLYAMRDTFVTASVISTNGGMLIA